MQPKWHILIGFIVSYILVYFFNFSLLAGMIIFLSSFLIDFDHVIRYIFLKKDINPKKFWNWSMNSKKSWCSLSCNQKRKIKFPIFFFHGIEFWIIILILAIFSPFFLWILIGILIHMIADISFLIYNHDPLYFKLSTIYTIITNKNKISISKLSASHKSVKSTR